jgi:YfiH family protein
MPVASESVQHIDDMLAAVGMVHGHRRTRKAVALSQLPGRRTRKAVPASPLQTVQPAGWDVFPWLVSGFSTRPGGSSTVYSADRATGELNLGYTEADSRTHVERNRKQLLRHLASAKPAAKLVTLKQVHSGLIRRVTKVNAAAMASLKGDGLITKEPGLLLAMQTADCVPVLVVDPVNRAVGAFHAGWRGTAQRIVERGIGLMRAEFGSDPSLLHAAIGPAIGQCCYSVGEELVHEFDSQFAYSRELFREVYDSDVVKLKYPLLFLTARAPGHSNIGPQTHLDLPEANRRQLLDAGLQSAHIWSSGECTACHTEKYFSHRGEHGFTGRMLSVVGVK